MVDMNAQTLVTKPPIFVEIARNLALPCVGMEACVFLRISFVSDILFHSCVLMDLMTQTHGPIVLHVQGMILLNAHRFLETVQKSVTESMSVPIGGTNCFPHATYGKQCTKEFGLYPCTDGSRCLTLDRLCNHVKDCDNREDEASKHCGEGKCQHFQKRGIPVHSCDGNSCIFRTNVCGAKDQPLHCVRTAAI